MHRENQFQFSKRTIAIEKNQRINEQIRITPMRVIGADGQQLGIIPTSEALAVAREAGLDLVEVSPNERPPVGRIMDFGKFKYQQSKKQHKGQTHQTKLKEIRLRPKTGEHDIEVKVKHAREFIEHKDKVLVTVVFRGRELAHMEEGEKLINDVIRRLEDVAKVESATNRQGKRISCMLTAK